jgi:hypothetical protein
MQDEQHEPIDRTGWQPGPWDKEPDRVEFKHRGLPCLITRNPMGHLCGYVAVPPGHALHGKDYEDSRVSTLPSHGGINYADKCSGRICHVPAPGEPDDVWWFGFDCAHGFDLSPMMTNLHMHPMPAGLSDLKFVYRDVPFVTKILRRLAAALADVG